MEKQTEKNDVVDGDERERDIIVKESFSIFIKKNLLIILLLTALVLGCSLGFILRLATDIEFTDDQVEYILFPGVLFLNMLKVLIIPLIVSSLISGMANLDQQASGKLGARAVIYYFSTTAIAVILGIIMVVTIQPGNVADDEDIDRIGTSEPVDTADAFMDLLRNIFPPNIVEACLKTYKTRQVETDDMDMDDMNETEEAVMYKSVGGFEDKSNILGIVVFSVAFGIVLGRMKEGGDPLRAFFNSLNEAVMQLVKIVIWVSPIGIFFLIMGKIIEMDDWAKMFSQIGMYMVTVIAGLSIHGIIILPLIYFVCVRKNPYRFLSGVTPALMTAFGTASSSATLPLTINCLEEHNHVDKRVTRFVLPIGATINMDGTALYEAVAAIFIAQVNGIDLDFKDIITISITATLASVGAAGVPQAGLVTMVIVLNAVGLPAEDVTLILVIDWFLDRIRTTVNVEGDSFGAGIIAHLCRKDLASVDAATDVDKLPSKHEYTNGGYDEPTFINLDDDDTKF
ncbi:excitatory amino acid transporter 3-like [Anneissia japonica]|uniref:excitatory amino acid transporter 3-like n=1 Tax=Anneissia japonica TaxID=1529436 RepID=UPI001425822D|nr:excitatory amino acid transporter 3-like [Anneissia japonica]